MAVQLRKASPPTTEERFAELFSGIKGEANRQRLFSTIDNARVTHGAQNAYIQAANAASAQAHESFANRLAELVENFQEFFCVECGIFLLDEYDSSREGLRDELDPGLCETCAEGARQDAADNRSYDNAVDRQLAVVHS